MKGRERCKRKKRTSKVVYKIETRKKSKKDNRVLNRESLKGLCHEVNILLKAYNNKKLLSVHALIAFLEFFDEKITL